MRIIPAIELSTDLPGASIHILGLFLNHQDADLSGALQRFREARLDARRADGRRARTRWACPSASSACSRSPAKAASADRTSPQALLEAGHIQTIDEAFERFIGRGGPAYFEGFRLEPAEGIRLIHSVGGFASWAHPNELDGKDWREYLPAVLEAGMDGLEAYYSKDYPPEVHAELLEACAAHDLVPTVGSDFHGFGTLKTPPGSVAVAATICSIASKRASRKCEG